MANHNSFLERLWEVFPRWVFLVGKFADPELKIKDKTLRVFIPDLHWLSAAALERYPKHYGFTGNSRLPNGKPLFAAFLRVLEELHEDEPEKLEIYQLGDAYDFWREMTFREEMNFTEEDAKKAYQRIRQDPVIGPLTDWLEHLDTTYVVGNHDHWLPQVVPPATRKGVRIKVKKEDVAANGKIRLSHGHEYDVVEMGLSNDIKASFVHACTRLKQSLHKIGVFSKKSTDGIQTVLKLRERPGFRKDFYPTVEPDGAYPIDQAADIDLVEAKYTTSLDISGFSKTPGSANDFDHISYLNFADQIVASEDNDPKDHSVHVIGHTHQARLLVDRIKPDNRPHVTLDCGGWLGLCSVFLKGKTETISVPSAQIGVQYGNDIRIYQLGSVE